MESKVERNLVSMRYPRGLQCGLWQLVVVKSKKVLNVLGFVPDKGLALQQQAKKRQRIHSWQRSCPDSEREIVPWDHTRQWLAYPVLVGIHHFRSLLDRLLISMLQPIGLGIMRIGLGLPFAASHHAAKQALACGASRLWGSRRM